MTCFSEHSWTVSLALLSLQSVLYPLLCVSSACTLYSVMHPKPSPRLSFTVIFIQADHYLDKLRAFLSERPGRARPFAYPEIVLHNAESMVFVQFVQELVDSIGQLHVGGPRDEQTVCMHEQAFLGKCVVSRLHGNRVACHAHVRQLLCACTCRPFLGSASFLVCMATASCSIACHAHVRCYCVACACMGSASFLVCMATASCNIAHVGRIL